MDIRHRSCTVCGESFVSPRTPGRPRELCSNTCRVIAQRGYRVNYILRQAGALAA
jgi:predicted nucleic acid-binding Zn ribbon protein